MKVAQTRRSPRVAGFEAKRLGGRSHYSGLNGYKYNDCSDARYAFGDALRAHGLVVGRVEADGNIHRVPIEGDKPGKRPGWYVMFSGGVAAGVFGNWKTHEHHNWWSQSGALSPVERKRMREAWIEAKRERDAERDCEQRKAQKRALQQWHQAAAPDPAHAYLNAKGVKAYGIRQRDHYLLVPMRDATGELWSVQTIAPDATKRFLRGARKRGLYHAIGGPVGDLIAICEGYATAVSVFEAKGCPVAVAFDCGNLEPVALVLREKYPSALIVICADNDSGTEKAIGRNPGREFAEKAARAVGGVSTWPDFSP